MDENELQDILAELNDNNDPLSGSSIPAGASTLETPLILDEPIPQPIAPQPVIPQTDLQIDASQLLKQYLAVYDKFLTNYDSDRNQIERTIKLLEDNVFNGPAQRVHWEMLVAALRTKAETNGNIVKALDSVAKILAAAKGTQVLINNNNGGNNQIDLAKLLDIPLYPDEQRSVK